MKKRMILMLAAAGVFIATIAAVKTRQIQAGMKQNASFQPPPEAVTTVVARQEQWPAMWNAIGSVAAVHGVTIAADLPGIVEKIEFASGQSVGAGAVLVRLDTRQEQAQLAAAEAARGLSDLNLKRAKDLVEQGIQAQADLDRLAAEQKQAVAKAGEIRATIERKTIRAPFAGVLGIRQVNLGQYLEAGAPIVPLQSIRPVYVNFSVPQQQVARLKVGSAIHATAEGAGVEADGRVTAVDSVINEQTRNVQIQATFDNANAKLRPGMFVKANIGLGAGESAVTVPTSAIKYAPYGDAVFIVEQVKGPKGDQYLGVRQQFVKLGASRGDQVAIVSGLKDGEQVVTSGVFKLRNGAAVKVNNQVQPGNNPAPKPEDS
ncbi:MAG TPA: efflux RND transporter periplasmic adaptor subunit [Thermoanaerobaculia bacterium]|nr:efflux RND transporter periplasmic adaptor subunit [Thermoanaerobaculia bacterium]